MSHQNQPPAAQMYQQGPPPKKKHTVRNVILILIAVFVLFVGGCMALIGSAANEVSKSLDKESQNDKPAEVGLGKAFDHDGYKVDAGWTLARDYGSPTIKNLHVTNTQKPSTGSGRTALLTFRFYKGTENLAEITCNGKELQKGESSSMDCFSTDKFPTGYKTIKVSDLW